VNYEFGNHILSGSGIIDGSKFTSGDLTNDKFSASIDFIQVPAQHTIQFTLTNALPKNSDYSNRIVIMMPDIMTLSENAQSVKNLDGKVRVPEIALITDNDDFEGCGSRICFSITYPGSY